MSKVIENKQLLHIVSEVIILIGLSLYFHRKTKRLTDHVNALIKKADEHDEIIQRHEQIIRQLVGILNQKTPMKQHPRRTRLFHNKAPLDPPLQTESQTNVNFYSDSEDEDEDEDDLDAEIRDELKELTREEESEEKSREEDKEKSKEEDKEKSRDEEFLLKETQ